MADKTTLTVKEVAARLPKSLHAKLKADVGAKALNHALEKALRQWPEDAALAAVRVIQLCGIIPSDALVAEIRGTSQISNLNSPIASPSAADSPAPPLPSSPLPSSPPPSS